MSTQLYPTMPNHITLVTNPQKPKYKQVEAVPLGHSHAPAASGEQAVAPTGSPNFSLHTLCVFYLLSSLFLLEHTTLPPVKTQLALQGHRPRTMSAHVKPLSELNPDYALLLSFPQEAGEATSEAKNNLSKLVETLSNAGFYTQARPADDDQLLLFVKLADAVLLKYLKGEGVKEYLYGVRGELDSDESLIHQLSTTTKSNAVHAIITNPVHEGGCGITTGSPDWDFVTKISPIWDYDENKRLLKSFFKLDFTETDIEKIRDVAGEKVALYFAYARFYLLALAVPSALGLISHFIFKRYSLVYTVLNSIWAIVFLAAWKKKQTVYALKWKTTGASKVEVRRPEFVGESKETDPVTGESVPTFSPITRTIRQISFLPFALVGIAILVGYQVSCFFIEIFLTEIYQGRGKMILGLVPTVLIVGVVPILTAIYEKFVDKALDFENHEYQSSYDRSKTQKMYIYNFCSAYVPLFITVFFYLPFFHKVNSYVPTISKYSSKWSIPTVSEHYQINNDRLTNQFGYFTFTAQIVGVLMENVVPITIRLVKEKLAAGKAVAKHLDTPEEAAFLNNIRQQLAMPEFDVDAEYRELTTQFGYLVVFGPVWSLAPLVSMFFNWIEIRGDAEKLLFECSRPVPRQAESIKPWDTHMRILTWLGSFVGPLVTVMYRRQSEVLSSNSYSFASSPVITPGWKLATTALISENVALGINFAVEALFNSATTSIEKEHTQQDLLMRRSYVDAYVQDAASLSKRDVEIDPTTSSWKSFSPNNVLKSAIGFPGLLAAAKAATEKAKASEKASKTTSDSVSSAADSIPATASKSGSQTHAEDAQLRSTTAASKNTPKTSHSTGETRNTTTTETDPTAANSSVNQYNAAPSSTSAAAPATSNSASGGDAALVGGGVAAGIATAVGVKPSEAPTSSGGVQSSEASKSAIGTPSVTSEKTIASDKAAVGIPVSSSGGATAAETTSPKKKRDFFGLGKKDLKGVGKAAKADAAGLAPELKSVGADVAKGDFSSAKKTAVGISKNPNQGVSHTKEALAGIKASKNEPTSGPAATSASASAPSSGAPASAAGTAPTGPLPPAPSSSSGEKSSSGLGAGAALGAGAGAAGIAASRSNDASASGQGSSEKTSRSKSLFKRMKNSGSSKTSADSSSAAETSAPRQSSSNSGVPAGSSSSAPHQTTAKGHSGVPAGASSSGISTSSSGNTNAQSNDISGTEKSDSAPGNSGSGISGAAAGLGATAAAGIGAAAAAVGLGSQGSDSTPSSKDVNSSSTGNETSVPSGSHSGAGAAAGASAGSSSDPKVSKSSDVSANGAHASGSAPTSAPTSAADGSPDSSSTPSKSKGLFGFGKKDISSIAKGAKADATKLAPEAKKIGGDLKHGDLSSAKQLASDVKSNPNEYIGNSKAAYSDAKNGQTAGTGAAGSTSSSGAATGHDSSYTGNDISASSHNPGAKSSGSGHAGTAAGIGATAAAAAGASAASSSDPKGSKSSDVSTNGASTSAGVGDTSANDASDSTSTPSKSKGFFSFGKKDVTSIATAAKEDAVNLGPDAKKVGGDLKHGDFSSAKQLASDVKADPTKYLGNTKAAYENAKTSETDTSATGSATGSAGNDTSAPPSSGAGISSSAPTSRSADESTPSTPADTQSESAKSSGWGSGIAAAVGAVGASVAGTAAAVTGSGSKSTTGDEVTANESDKTPVTGVSAPDFKGVSGSDSTSTPTGVSESKAASGSGSVPDSTRVDTSADNSTSKSGSTGFGLGAAAAAIGLGGSERKETASPASSSGSPSLAGATLPPDFEKKAAAANSKKTSAYGSSPSGTDGDHGSSSATTAGRKSDADTPQQKTTLDPKASSGAADGAQSAQATDSSSKSNHSGLGTGALAGGVAGLSAAGAGLASKLGSGSGAASGSAAANGASNGASNGQDGSFVDSAKSYAEKGGKSLNDYVQLAADKVDDYAKTSNNEYVTKGNTYVQKLADGIDDYTHKQETSSTSTSGATTSASGVGAGSGAGAGVGATPSTPKQSRAATAQTPQSAANGGVDADTPSHQVNNTNPFSGETAPVNIVGDTLAPPKPISGDTQSHSRSSSTASSPSKRKKKGLLSKIKEKVSHSPSSTPTKP